MKRSRHPCQISIFFIPRLCCDTAAQVFRSHADIKALSRGCSVQRQGQAFTRQARSWGSHSFLSSATTGTPWHYTVATGLTTGLATGLTWANFKARSPGEAAEMLPGLDTLQRTRWLCPAGPTTQDFLYQWLLCHSDKNKSRCHKDPETSNHWRDRNCCKLKLIHKTVSGNSVPDANLQQSQQRVKNKTLTPE